MNSFKHRSPRLPKEIADQAVEWLLEEQEGLTPARAAQFQTWRQADPRHALAVAKAEQTLALLGELPELKDSPALQLDDAPAVETPAAERRGWRSIGAWTAAAAAAVVALAAIWW